MTSWTDADTNRVVSYAIEHCGPLGNRFDSSSILLLIWLCKSSALVPGSW
jgi:hypothetical protein